MRRPESIRAEGDAIILHGADRVGSLDPMLSSPKRAEVCRLLERDRDLADAWDLGFEAREMGQTNNPFRRR